MEALVIYPCRRKEKEKSFGGTMERVMQSSRYRTSFFLLVPILLFLPFLLKNSLVTYADDIFHISRFHELFLELNQGQLFPDIVRYSGTQNWGYGLNFFYPSFVTYPIIILWKITGLPVTSIILFDIFIVYFALHSNFSIVHKITENSRIAFMFSITYVLTAGIGLVLNGGGNPIARMEYLNLYAASMVVLIAPVALLSFYTIIFLQKPTTWLRAAIYSSICLMLSIPVTLGIVVSVIVMLIVAIVRGKIDQSKLIELTKSLTLTIALSAVFIFPFLEQRAANSWSNLPVAPDLFNQSFSAVITRILNISDALSILVILCSVMLVFYKKFTRRYQKLLLGYIAGMLFLYSNIFPWYLLNPILSGALQFTERWNYIPAIFGSMLVAYAVDELSTIKKKLIPILCLALVYLAINGMMLNTVAKHFHVTQEQESSRSDYLTTPTPERINAGFFLVVNNKNIQVFFDYPDLASGDYRAKDQARAYSDIYNKSQVIFDGAVEENKTSIRGRDLYIADIPKGTRTVQAPVTYLKGFSAHDDKGRKLESYNNANGFLEIQPAGAKTITISYTKTRIHHIGIILTAASWTTLVLYAIYSYTIGKRNRRAKITESDK